MRIYAKDKTISYRVSRYWWQEKAYLTLTAQLLIDTSTGQSLPDKVLWEHTAKDLGKIQPGILFDQGKAKVNAEFFAAGYAYAYDDQTTVSTVQINIEQHQKTAAIYGDRYWTKSGPFHSMSAPKPFKQIALSWTNAFGGKNFSSNPHGKGLDPDEQALWPLANIENPREIISHPQQQPQPVGFLPTTLTPQQRERLGTFDDQWAKKAWPYLPLDHDLHFWNWAPKDQQQTPFWTGKEQITCIHMHPSQPVWQFTLRNHKVRAFYQKKNQLATEMQLNLDTIWVFPHLEQVSLIWHGTIPIMDETAFDIEAMLLVEENPYTSTLSCEHYYALLDKKIHRSPPPIIAKEPKPKPKSPSILREPSAEIQKKIAAHKARSAKIFEQSKAKNAVMTAAFNNELAKFTPENQKHYQIAKTAQPKTPPIRYDRKLSFAENTAAMIAFIEQQMDPKIRQLWQDARNKTPAPPDFKAMQAKLEKIFAALPDQTAQQNTFDKIKAALAKAEVAYKHRQESPPVLAKVPPNLTEKIAKALQEKCFKQILICDQRFDHTEFTDTLFHRIRFKNCQFNACVFKHCQMNNVSFDQCTLEQTTFNTCQLEVNFFVNTTLLQSAFYHCTLDRLKVEKSHYENTLFDQCIFRNNRWQESTWAHCQFLQCQETNSHLKKINANNIAWRKCVFTRVYTDSCTLEKIDYDHCQFQSVNITDCTIQNMHFHAGQSKAFSFDHCQLGNMSFNRVEIPCLQIKHSKLLNWQVVDSDFSKLFCSHTTLQNIEFNQSNFNNSRYKNLTRVENLNFEHITLQKAFFEESLLEHLQLNHCDLTKSIWHRCQIRTSQFKANLATLSRFEDCLFEHTLLHNNNYFQGSFKRSCFKNSEVSECNLVRVNFYHASCENLALHHCLLPDPLPVGFWERWQEVKHE